MSEYRNERKRVFVNNIRRLKSIKRKEHRQLSRERKYRETNAIYDDYNQICNMDNLFDGYYMCRKNVHWKRRIQHFGYHLMENIGEMYYWLLQNKMISRGYKKFDINERGKLRHISSPDISERIVQIILYKKVLYPILTPCLIFDNGASLKGKGVEFARRRIKYHLADFYRRYGVHGWMLLIDFKGYFESINHEVALSLLSMKIHDQRVLSICQQIFKQHGDCGVGLGSQLSQIIAVYYPNRIDHCMKETFHMKYYGRYMDDTYIIHPDRDVLEQCLKAILLIADQLKITINMKKTKIIKLENDFVFLKTKYHIEPETGRIVCISGRSSAKRERRKLRMWKRRLELPDDNPEKVNIETISQSYKSWRMFIDSQFDAHHLLLRMDDYYYNLFGERPDLRKPRKRKRHRKSCIWNTNFRGNNIQLQNKIKRERYERLIHAA